MIDVVRTSWFVRGCVKIIRRFHFWGQHSFLVMHIRRMRQSFIDRPVHEGAVVLISGTFGHMLVTFFLKPEALSLGRVGIYVMVAGLGCLGFFCPVRWEDLRKSSWFLSWVKP